MGVAVDMIRKTNNREGEMGLLSACRAGLIAGLLMGCTTFDPMDQRGETVNRSAADYANDATLLNVVRATEQEPLTFITITGLDGTESASGTLGLPSLGLGPTATASPRNYIFGSNSVTRANSNTYHISVIDDPASFAGLMAPVNPAIIAFLLRQGYSTPQLFFLLTSEIRKVQVDGKTGEVTRVDDTYVNDPSDVEAFGKFTGKMASLLAEGLVAQVDATAFPSGKVLPASRLCIDTAAPPPAFGDFWKARFGYRVAHNPALCENAPWIEADVAATASGGGGSGSGLTAMGVARDGSLWATLAPKNQLLRVAQNGGVLVVTMPKGLVPPAQAKSPSHMAAFEFEDISQTHYQIFLRSTFGAYSYIGAYERSPHKIDNLLRTNGSSTGGLLDPIDGPGKDCFAQATYRGKPYCVPQDAGNTKQLFAILHLLQQLQTAPSNAPTTLTVTPAL